MQLVFSAICALTLLVDLSEGTRLENAVQFKVIKHPPVAFKYAEAVCARHGYSLAPFHERVIPLLLRAVKAARVKKVWAAGNNRLNPAASIRRPSPKIHDLSVTFMEKHSPALGQKLPVLCAMYHSQSSSTSSQSSLTSSSSSKASSTSSSASSGPDMGYPLSKSSFGRAKAKGNKKGTSKVTRSSKPKHGKKRHVTTKQRTESGDGMLIVSSKKMPRFTVRVDGVPADPTSRGIQKLITQLRKVPLHNNHLHQEKKSKQKHHRSEGKKGSKKKPRHAH